MDDLARIIAAQQSFPEEVADLAARFCAWTAKNPSAPLIDKTVTL